MPNTPRPRKVRKILKKLFKGKSTDKGLQELSDENYRPGKTPPNKTPQTSVTFPVASPDTFSDKEPKSKKGEPAMADSEGKPMTPGQQRRAIKKVKKAEKKSEKDLKKAKKKAEREKRRSSRPNRTPQTDVMGRKIPTAKSGEPLKQEAKSGTPAMVDSQGRPMRRGQQRRATRRSDR